MYLIPDHSGQHYLVAAQFMERLAVNKQRFHMARLNLKRLKVADGKGSHRLQVSNRFAALEDVDAEVENNSASETIIETTKISTKEKLGYYEMKKYKPLFEESCSNVFNQMKQAKLQTLQDPSKVNGDNLNNVRCEASRHFRNKRRNI
jgi:hypothetical protein